jgi:flavin-binding protein dodecin
MIQEGKIMGNNVYKLIEITGTSTKNIDDAVQSAIARAAATVRNMQWFEVIEVRGRINEDRVAQWQVTLKIGFTLEE